MWSRDNLRSWRSICVSSRWDSIRAIKRQGLYQRIPITYQCLKTVVLDGHLTYCLCIKETVACVRIAYGAKKLRYGIDSLTTASMQAMFRKHSKYNKVVEPPRWSSRWYLGLCLMYTYNGKYFSIGTRDGCGCVKFLQNCHDQPFTLL